MRGEKKVDPSARLEELQNERTKIAGTAHETGERLRTARQLLAELPQRLAAAHSAQARGGDAGRAGALSAEGQALRIEVGELTAKLSGLNAAVEQIGQEIAALYDEHREHFTALAVAASGRYLEAERKLYDAVEAAAYAWQEVGQAWQVVRRDRDSANPHLNALPVVEFDGIRHALAGLRSQPPYPRSMVQDDDQVAA